MLLEALLVAIFTLLVHYFWDQLRRPIVFYEQWKRECVVRGRCCTLFLFRVYSRNTKSKKIRARIESSGKILGLDKKGEGEFEVEKGGKGDTCLVIGLGALQDRTMRDLKVRVAGPPTEYIIVDWAGTENEIAKPLEDLPLLRYWMKLRWGFRIVFDIPRFAMTRKRSLKVVRNGKGRKMIMIDGHLVGGRMKRELVEHLRRVHPILSSGVLGMQMRSFLVYLYLYRKVRCSQNGILVPCSITYWGRDWIRWGRLCRYRRRNRTSVAVASAA